MNKLINKLSKIGSNAESSIMSESEFFQETIHFKTDLPILNIAFSGEVDGGYTPGVTSIVGESRTFKSALSLFCLKSYLDIHQDGIGIIYDSEYGITPEVLKSYGIDLGRILHVPIDHVEQLKFDMVKKLEEIKKGDKVFFLLDSLGQLPSKKEVEDAIGEKSVADMTRAKSIRSFLRMVTSNVTKKQLPFFIINHVYKSQDFMPVTVIPGGTAATYSANCILVVTKSQEKDGTELSGWNFNLTTHKSRYVKEKSRFSFRVMYENGIQKYSGILDMALEGNFIQKPSNGWYQLVDQDTGEMVGQKVRAADAESPDFIGKVLKNEKFKKFVSDKYKLSVSQMMNDDEVAAAFPTEDEEISL
jgi:RecA/RadA recombinase